MYTALDWSTSEDANAITPESASRANPARGVASSNSEYKPLTVTKYLYHVPQRYKINSKINIGHHNKELLNPLYLNKDLRGAKEFRCLEQKLTLYITNWSEKVLHEKICSITKSLPAA